MLYRVEKTAKLIQISIEEILKTDKVRLSPGIIASVVHVDVSQNLSSANIYLSFFSKENPTILLQMIKKIKPEIRHLLAAKVRRKLQRVPEIYFYLDTSIQEAFRLDTIIKNLKVKN